ncbi:MAG: cyclic pyranopterin monophosphate synthase MoaC [Bacteriovoracaceae bacterium]
MLTSHLNENGNAHMVDISDKVMTNRMAQAQSKVILPFEVMAKIQANAETKKGNLFSVCILAGIMGAKKTSELIPLCHPLPLTKVEVTYECVENTILFTSQVKTQWVTGVEMEAMVAVSIAALTCYDMLKSLNKGIVLGETKLLFKTGGKSGDFSAEV